MPPPYDTAIFRITHVDNLATLLRRGGLHSTHHTPNDGLPYRTIHIIMDITVPNAATKARVEAVLDGFPAEQRKLVNVNPEWYYY
jgi:hypothetical protein